MLQAPTIAQMAAVITGRQIEKLEKQHLNLILADLEALPEEEARRLSGGTEVIEDKDE